MYRDRVLLDPISIGRMMSLYHKRRQGTSQVRFHSFRFILIFLKRNAVGPSRMIRGSLREIIFPRKRPQAVPHTALVSF